MVPLKSAARGRIAILTVVVLLVALTASAGSAAAHNPACHQVAGADGPHYDDDDRTGSDVAFEKNKNLGGDERANAEQGTDCGAPNERAPHR